MVQHSVLSWRPLEGDAPAARKEDFICPLRVLESSSADCMLAAISAAQPQWRDLRAASRLGVLAITCDAAKANLRLSHHLLNSLPDNVLGLQIHCLHHQDSLVMKPVSELLDFQCSLFCAVKQLQKGKPLALRR